MWLKDYKFPFHQTESKRVLTQPHFVCATPTTDRQPHPPACFKEVRRIQAGRQTPHDLNRGCLSLADPMACWGLYIYQHVQHTRMYCHDPHLHYSTAHILVLRCMRQCRLPSLLSSSYTPKFPLLAHQILPSAVCERYNSYGCKDTIYPAYC